MEPETAGLNILRNQLGYSLKSLVEKDGIVSAAQSRLDEAVADRAQMQQRVDEIKRAIQVLETHGGDGDG